MDRMLSKIAFSILVIIQLSSANYPLSLIDDTSDPIESLFGSGYICLHISDPRLESSPSFQALARELAKKFNKTPVVHKIGSNETDHRHGPDTISNNKFSPTTHQNASLFKIALLHFIHSIHYGPDSTTVRPHVANLVKQPLQCNEAGFFGNPNNCTRFYRCIEPMGKGKPWQIVEFDCAPGTIFDKAIGQCNHPNAVNPKPECWSDDEFRKGMRGQQTTPPPQQQPELPPDFEVPPQEPEPGQEQQVPEGPYPPFPGHEVTDDGDLERKEIVEEFRCPRNGDFADEHDCGKFYQCRRGPNGQYTHRACGKGEIFDEVEGECRSSNDVEPKPKCWHKKSRKRIIKDEITEITKDYEAPDEEDFDEFESSGKTQSVHTPDHIHKKVATKIEETETDITEGVDSATKNLKGKKKRITIPKPTGPKPIPQCSRPGIFPHPTECGKYIKCIQKGNGPLKLYRFNCNPTGTVFDISTNDCVEPKMVAQVQQMQQVQQSQLLDQVPDCAKWDDHYRLVFEDILNEEVDEVEPDHETPPDELVPEPEYELVDDGKGGKRKHYKNRTETTTIIDETIEGEDSPSKNLGNKKYAHHAKQKGHHIHTEKITKTHEEQEITEEDGQQRPDSTPDLPPDHETPPEEPLPPMTKSDEKMGCPCIDQEMMERLMREKDEALERVNDLEKGKSKLESQVKKLTRELGVAKKDKQKLENYISNMDKTIDDYKEQVGWYLQHCPQPTEFLDEESGQKMVKARKRRSLDIPVASYSSIRRKEDGLSENEMEKNVKDYTKMKYSLRPGVYQVTPQGVVTDFDASYSNSPFTDYDEIDDTPHNKHGHNRDGSNSHPHGGHHHRQHQKEFSSWDNYSDDSFFYANIPLFIFIILLIIFLVSLTCSILIVKRLLKMSKYSMSHHDDEMGPMKYKLNYGSRKYSSEV